MRERSRGSVRQVAGAASLALLLGLGCAPRVPAAGAAADPAARTLPAARLDGNYFFAADRRFLVLGAHWVPAKAGLQWPVIWPAQEIEADFAQMARMGFNTVRLDLFWAWFEPRPGDYNSAAFEQLDFLIKLAHRYHIYLHPTLFVGGEVGEAYWDVPWRHGRNPQSDPEMLRLQTNLAAELGRRYAHETAILAWDLTDEPPFWIAKGTTDAMAVNWTRLIGGGLRRYDTLHPILVGVSTEDLDHGPFRADTIAGEVDLLSVHPYTIYEPELFPDPMLSLRGTYGAAFQATLSAGTGRPVLVQELGASSAQYAPETIARYERTAMYSALAAGANGVLVWCYTDAAPEQYRRVPYLRAAHETQFGLTTWDRKLRPQGESFVEFIRTVQRLRLEGLALPHADAAIIVPREWARTGGDFSGFGLSGPEVIPYTSVSDGGAVAGQPSAAPEGNPALMSALLATFILAHQAGLRPALPREGSHWEQYPVVLLPAPLTATDPVLVHVHTDFWERAHRYVADGGVLYASLAATSAIPDMAELFGARMTDARPLGQLVLTFVKPFGRWQAGDSLTLSTASSGARSWGTGLEVTDGEVVAVDQDQHPALVQRRLGKGRTLLSAYPLEAWLGAQPSAFEAATNVYRILQVLSAGAATAPLVHTDQPDVEAAAWTGPQGGYVLLVNHGPEARATQLTSTFRIGTLQQVKAGGTERVVRAVATTPWTIEVPAYAGVVLEWRP